MKVVALVGSLRKNSYNLNLVQSIKERYVNKFDLSVADLGALPHYNQDDELNPPESVAAFKKQIAEADAVIIATPEYNWSIPGVLKNALDWASRVDKVLVNKPVLVVGATMGSLGTIRAQLHLREILTGMQARLLPPSGNEVLVSAVHQKFNEAGQLTDEATLAFLDSVIDKFVAWI